MGGPGSGPRGGKRVFEMPEDTFSSCPEGHSLPHAIGELECAPTRCAASLEPAAPMADRKHGLLSEPQAEEIEHRRLKGRERVRRKAVPVPEGLTGPEAEAHVERRLVELAPAALAEQEYFLRFGSDAERERASRFLLEANGYGKKERAGGGAQLIIVNGFSGVLPWAKPGKVVEARVEAPVSPPALPEGSST